MTGEFFIRTRTTIALAGNATGIDANGWADAQSRYGMGLEEGALAKLMTPAPNKKPTGNSNVVTNGVAYLGSTIGVKDERTLSIEVHVIAETEANFLSLYSLICSEILDCGYIQVKTKYQTNTVYHLIYQDCQQYSQFNMKKAKMTLSFIEPHPEYRIPKSTM